ELDPEQADAPFNLGNVLREQRQFAAAETAYREAIARNPNHAGAFANLANLYVMQERKEAAAQTLGELGNLLQNLGRAAEADKASSQSLSIVSDPAIEVQRALSTPVIAMSTAEVDATRDRLMAAMSAMRDRSVRLDDPLPAATSALFYTAYHG